MVVSVHVCTLAIVRTRCAWLTSSDQGLIERWHIRERFPQPDWKLRSAGWSFRNIGRAFEVN
jgi:hypothetical protein